MNTDSNSDRSHRYKDTVLTRLKKKNHILFGLTILANLAYLLWLSRVLDWHLIFASLFLVAELICFFHILIWGSTLSEERLHPRETMPWKGRQPDVDLLITVCKEPIEIVRSTLEAVAKIDYPHLHVMVLDDGHSKELKELAQKLGLGYSARKERNAAKAGNLNHGLRITNSPYVMTLDADQVPKPEVIHRMIGYFQIPKIGFVSSAQSYRVPPGDPWGNRDTVFYQAMQISRNAHNASISCGSGVIYRRKAIEEIGGFSEWSLVEDLHSSMLMEEKGWRSVYYPFALTEGAAPTDIFAQQRQRGQWATDSLRIFFWDNPLFRKGLSWYQKASYLQFGLHYIMFGIAYPIYFMMPIWVLLNGQFVLNAPLWLFLAYRMPSIGFMLWMNSSMTNQKQDIHSFQVQAGLWFVYLAAIFTALAHPQEKPEYRVNTKVVRSINFFARALALMPNLLLISLSLGAIVYGYLHYHQSRPSYLWIHVFWCGWAIFAVSRPTLVGLFPEWFAGRRKSAKQGG